MGLLVPRRSRGLGQGSGAVDTAVIRRGAGYTEAVVRQSDNGAAATSHGNRFFKDDIRARHLVRQLNG